MEERIAKSSTHLFAARFARSKTGPPAGLFGATRRWRGTAGILQEEVTRSANEEPWHPHRREDLGENDAGFAFCSLSRS